MTYLKPGRADARGNHASAVYVEDRDEPGTDVIWKAIRDKDAYVFTRSESP